MTKSRGHTEFIGSFEYFKVDGRLYRVKIDKPLVDGRRVGEFVTVGSGIPFAMQMARLQLKT